MKLGDYTDEVIREALSGMSGRANLREVKKQLSIDLRCSVREINRRAQRLGLSIRNPRKDRGAIKKIIPEPVWQTMRFLTVKGDLGADTVRYTTTRASDLPEEFISLSTIRDRLRKERVSRADNARDNRPYVEHAWTTAGNQIHQFDATVALPFYANDDGSIGHEAGYERYKNKTGNRKPRLILWTLVDNFSSAFFAQFCYSENSITLMKFLAAAWSQKQDKRFPFYGIPERYYCDAGAPAKSQKAVNFFKALGTEKIKTDPAHWTVHGSRKFGRHERTFGDGLLKEFMKITAIHRFASIDELNSSLFGFLVRRNNKPFGASGEPRFARWLRTVGTPRLTPAAELTDFLHWERDTRKVENNLRIKLNGKVFQLPHNKVTVNWTQRTVEVFWYPGREEEITAFFENKEFIAAVVKQGTVIHHQYQAAPKTRREEIIENMAAQPPVPIDFATIYSPKNDLVYLPKKGKAFDPSGISQKIIVDQFGSKVLSREKPEFLDRTAAAIWLRSEGFRDATMSDASNAWLTALLAERETISDVELREAAALYYGDPANGEAQEVSLDSLNYIDAATWLRNEGFRNKAMTEAERTWLKNLIGDREKIPDRELREAAEMFYRDRAAGE